MISTGIIGLEGRYPSDTLRRRSRRAAPGTILPVGAVNVNVHFRRQRTFVDPLKSFLPGPGCRTLRNGRFRGTGVGNRTFTVATQFSIIQLLGSNICQSKHGMRLIFYCTSKVMVFQGA